MAKAKSYTLPFSHKREVASGIYSFYFKRENFPDFIPGQYVYVTLPHDNVDDRGTTRYFTIASSPTEKEYLMITTKVIQSSFKKKLFSLTSHDSITAFGPMGTFILDETDTTERVFVGGGMGITPYRSMLVYAAHKKLQILITVLLSFPTREEVLFLSELEEITKQNSSIKIIYTLTQEVNEQWRGEKGKFSEDFIKKHVPDIHAPKFSLVGPSQMVDETKLILINLGIPQEKIMIEDFHGY